MPVNLTKRPRSRQEHFRSAIYYHLLPSFALSAVNVDITKLVFMVRFSFDIGPLALFGGIDDHF